MTERLQSLGWSTLSFAGLVAVWWALTAFHAVPQAFVPGPGKVWSTFLVTAREGTLFHHMGLSLARLLIAFVAASLLGIAAGLVMGLVPGVGRFSRPVLTLFNSLSGITWLPLAIAWFGIGWTTFLFVIFNSVFFITVINTLSGVQAVPRVYEQAVLTMGGGQMRVISQVLIPGAMPSIITGLRLGMGFGWRALIAVEMVAGSAGLGYMVFNASYNFHQDVLLMGVLVTGVLASVIDQVVFQPLERWTIERWGLV